MTKKLYDYEIQGTGANGQTWVAAGVVECEWPDVFQQIMMLTFETLTKGKAQYGHPGVGCSGPYDVTGMKVEQQPM